MQIVRAESLAINPTLFDYIAETAFNHWMYWMMKKWEVSLCRGTTTSKTPQNICHNDKIKTDFLEYFKFKVNLLCVSEDDILNADKTNLPFSMDNQYTWAACNSRRVLGQEHHVKSACNNNAFGTKKFPPFILFNCSSSASGPIYQELRHHTGYPNPVKLAVQKKARFNEEIMLK
jgi:hypothetical protein